MQYFFNVTSFLFLTKMNTSFLLLFSFFFSTSYIYIVSTIDAIRHSHLFSQEKSFLRVFFIRLEHEHVYRVYSALAVRRSVRQIFERHAYNKQQTELRVSSFLPLVSLRIARIYAPTHAYILFLFFFLKLCTFARVILVSIECIRLWSLLLYSAVDNQQQDKPVSAYSYNQLRIIVTHGWTCADH